MKQMMKNKDYMTQIRLYILLPFLLILSCSINAGARHFRDTVHFKKNIAEKNALVLTDSALNEIGIDSILNKIENVHNTLYRIINATSVGFNTQEVEENLPEIDSNIEIIDENLSIYTNVLDVKNLQMFDVLLSSLQNQLTDWRNLLFKYDKELVTMSDEMGAFKRDTLLKEIIADSAFRSLYINEINDLKSKWRVAKKSISDNISRINQLQAYVSNEYFTTIDLQNKSIELHKRVSGKTLGKEYDYLWNIKNIPVSDTTQNDRLAKRAYLGQKKILHYYFKRNVNNQLWMLFAGVLFLIWIFRNFTKIGKSPGKENTPLTPFRLINKVPVLATLVVLFNIAPFFDLHPPTAYVIITGWLLAIVVTIMLSRTWSKKIFYYWLVIAGLYAISSATGPLLTPDLGFRIFLLSFNIISLAFGIFWFRAIGKNTIAFSVMIKIVSIICIVFNLTAIVCNLFGRLSLAKIFSVTASHALMQIICLSVFIEIVMESFQLQAMVNKLKGGISAKLNFEKIQRLLRNAATIISILVWTIVCTISLNIYNFLFEWGLDFLTKERKIGSTTFEIGNILLFIAIIYVSNMLQQGVGSLYGKEDATWDPEVKKNGSRLAMTRLVLIVIGFLIAVAASGIPMDKITIVLGALGVGIGLGLQSIVNNLVSGVILIFEQPFRIGDFIELGDKKGRVLDIGIRSSKIVMDEGAEIIMPNADLLSGRVINWTLRNDNVRIDLPITILPGNTFEAVQKILLALLEKNQHVIMVPPPQILLSGVTDKSMNVNIQVWINDVHNSQSIKSELLNSIFNGLAQSDVKVA